MRPYVAVFLSVLLAELGDKTQLATLIFATDPGLSRVRVFLAAAAALVTASGIAVIVGAQLSDWLPANPLKAVVLPVERPHMGPPAVRARATEGTSRPGIDAECCAGENRQRRQKPSGRAGPAPPGRSDMKRAIAALALISVAVMALVVGPGEAVAGSSTDAALALGAFAVLNQIVAGQTIFSGPPQRVVTETVVVQQPVVVLPPAVVYTPPPPVVYAPPPVVVYPSTVYYYPSYRYVPGYYGYYRVYGVR
jgi:hypothetical protein